MGVAEYHLISQARIEGTSSEVAAVFARPTDLVRWFPAVFLGAESDDESRPPRPGTSVRLHAKGWLPYTLRCTFSFLTVDDTGFTATVSGDFDGRCRCASSPVDRGIELLVDWDVRVRRPLVRYLSPLLRPVFTANHRWVVRRGVESLEIELARRAAATHGRPYLRTPPGPTFPYDRRTRRLGAGLSRFFQTLRQLLTRERS